MNYKIGIDVGGTFTDFFLWASDGSVESSKALSTRQDPSEAVLAGLEAVASSRGMQLREFAGRIDTIVHGTTVATNAVLTRSCGATALLTTEGVRDALEMRRGIREERYNNRCRNVVPLVPRRLRRTVRGRIDYAGSELAPINLDDVRAAAEVCRAEGVAAVAICFMNSFANPAHEGAAADAVRKELPAAYLSVSSELLPTIRFYNRVSTTVLNAYVGPVLGAYLQSLTARLAEIGFGGVLLIMQSNGGVALPGVTMRQAANTLLSGPAGGPHAGAAYAREQGSKDCIVVDMGGTSFDASLVHDGRAALNTEGEIDRLRIALPMLGIHTIGAGGGSIGRIDEGGLLRMGPESAGSLPGPACYGRGGTLPACTDADLVLGYLDPAFFAGGAMKLDVAAAREAIDRHVARPLGVDIEAAAAGMYRVINANMAHGIREITVKRGLDPREFPLVVAGGAGPVHACMMAAELEIPAVIVPSTASVLCAAGMLLGDLRHDAARSYVTPVASLDPGRLKALVADMVVAGRKQLRDENVPEDRIEHTAALDLRYLKQYHEVTVPVAGDCIDRFDLKAVIQSFHERHNQLFGYDLSVEGTGLELINVRVQSVGRTDKPALPRVSAGGQDPAAALKGRRLAFSPERAVFVEMPVFDGHALKAGNIIPGPALIERTDTTIVVSASFTARVDELGSAVLDAAGGGAHA